MSATIGDRFKAMKKEGRTAFIPYITAGDPDLAATERFVLELAAAGAAAIELGVPFSDPMADGPVNQRAAERALRQGTSLRGILALVERLRGKGLETPIILFTYFNPIHRLGTGAFAEAARAAGVTGVLCVDLPPEEAGEYAVAMNAASVEMIFLASPTTDAARLKLIDRSSTSVIYYVSRTGVTGQQADLSAGLEGELTRMRAGVTRAVMVGFGISTPEQARAVGAQAEGVVVGSAIVKLIEDSKGVDDAVKKLGEFARGIVNSLKGNN